MRRALCWAFVWALALLLSACEARQVTPLPEVDVTPLEFFATDEQGELWVPSKGDVAFLVQPRGESSADDLEEVKRGLYLEFQHDGQRQRLPIRWSESAWVDGRIGAVATTVDLALPIGRVGRLAFVDGAERPYGRIRARVVCEAFSCPGMRVLPVDTAAKRARLEQLMSSRALEAFQAARAYAALEAKRDPLKAEEAWTRAAEVAMRLRLTSQRARSHLWAAFYALEGSRLEKARVHLQVADKVLLDVRDPQGHLLHTALEARLFRTLGRTSEARRMLESVLDRAPRFAFSEIRCSTLEALAQIAGDETRHEAAVKMFHEAIACRSELGEAQPKDEGRLYARLGWALLRTELLAPGEVKIAEAQSAFSKAEASAESIHDVNGQAHAVASQAWALFAAGDMARAGEYLRRARAMSPGTLDRRWPALHVLEGRVHLAAREPEAALRAFEAGIAESDSALTRGQVDVPWDAYFAAAEAHILLDDRDEARLHFESGMQMLETNLRAEVLPQGPGEVVRNRARVVDPFIRFLLEEGDYARAFEVIDYLHGVTSRALRRDARIYELPTQVEQQWLDLLDRRQVASERLEATIARCPRLTEDDRLDCRAGVRRHERSTRTAFERVAKLLDGQGGRSAPSDVDALRRRLRNDEAVALVDDVGERRFVLLLNSRGVRFAWLVAPEGVEDPLPAVLNELGVGATAHLYWVSSRPPSDAIRTRGPLSRLRSAFALTSLPLPPSDDYRGVVVADPSLDLPDSRVEGGEVTALLQTGPEGEEHGVVLLQGETATLARVQEGLSRAGVFHYVGHVVRRASPQWEAHLQLAEGARLTMPQVARMTLAGPIVFLSGPSSEGDVPAEGLGLADAFLTAGARTVVTVAEEVSTEDMRDFVTRFYKARGATEPARAAAVAAAEMRDNESPAWRAFHVWGRR